jgi:hypothetical protein
MLARYSTPSRSVAGGFDSVTNGRTEIDSPRAAGAGRGVRDRR